MIHTCTIYVALTHMIPYMLHLLRSVISFKGVTNLLKTCCVYQVEGIKMKAQNKFSYFLSNVQNKFHKRDESLGPLQLA